MVFDAKDSWEKRLNHEFGLHKVGFLGIGKNFNHWMYKVRKKAL